LLSQFEQRLDLFEVPYISLDEFLQVSKLEDEIHSWSD